MRAVRNDTEIAHMATGRKRGAIPAGSIYRLMRKSGDPSPVSSEQGRADLGQRLCRLALTTHSGAPEPIARDMIARSFYGAATDWEASTGIRSRGGKRALQAEPPPHRSCGVGTVCTGTERLNREPGA